MKKLALLFVFAQSLAFANNPVITLNGDSVVELYLNTYYDDPGATAFDSEDGDLSNSIVITGTYDSSTVGSYVLAYSVTDSDGNQSVEIRTINVVDNSIMSFDVTATHSFSNQGAIGVGDTVIIYVTVKNTGNTNLSVHHGDYILNDFNGNPLLLTSQGWHGDNYNISVGSSLTLESTYVLNQTTLDSGGLEFSINVYDYYWDNNQSIRIDKTSNLLSVAFSGSSDEIILDGKISANNNQIKKVADPTDNLDAVNKRYVDQRTLEQTISGQNIGDLLYWNGQSWQKLSAPLEQSTLRFCEGQLTWGNCPPVISFTRININHLRTEENNFDCTIGYNIELNGSWFDSEYMDYGLYFSYANQTPNANDLSWIYSRDGQYWDWKLDNHFNVNLEINLTYYLRLFVYYNDKHFYSDVVTFTTPVLDDYDQDEDGYTVNEGDCNDSDDTVYPGAPEINTGIDNNCDGLIEGLYDHPLAQTSWSLAEGYGSFGVGPEPGDISWWNFDNNSSSGGCKFDDVFTFHADGSFEIFLGSETWIEAWQNIDINEDGDFGDEGCYPAVDPYVSSIHQWSADANTFSLTGEGAYIVKPPHNYDGSFWHSFNDGDPLNYNFILDGDVLEVFITGFNNDNSTETWYFLLEKQ